MAQEHYLYHIIPSLTIKWTPLLRTKTHSNKPTTYKENEIQHKSKYTHKKYTNSQCVSILCSVVLSRCQRIRAGWGSFLTMSLDVSCFGTCIFCTGSWAFRQLSTFVGWLWARWGRCQWRGLSEWQPKHTPAERNNHPFIIITIPSHRTAARGAVNSVAVSLTVHMHKGGETAAHTIF